MQRAVLFPWVLAVLLCSTLLVRAHVVVHPREARAGSYEAFTVRCPNEKDKPTLTIELEIPDKDVAIHHYEAKPGWKIALQKNTSGNATKVTWTAEEGSSGLLPDQFVEFRIMGKINSEAKSIVWNAFQSYAGDEVVNWTGEPGSKTPASVTKLTSGNNTGSHDHAHSDDHGTASINTISRDEAKSQLAFNVALGALLLSGAALLAGFLRKP